MDTIKEGYTRVSDILGQWSREAEDENGRAIVAKKMSGSNQWIDIQVLDNKAEIGTCVHDAIKNHIDGVFTPLNGVSESYFDSYLAWEKAANFKLVNREERYYCDKLMITGQVDAIITLPGDELPCIVDFKTSANESPKIWPLQASFYHYLAEESGLKLSNRMLFIQLSKKGFIPKVYEYTFSKDFWNVCMSAWTCYRHLNS